MTIFLLHLALMMLIVCVVLKPGSVWSVESRFLAAFVVTWTSIIISSTILACFSQLGNDLLFFPFSLACQLLLSAILSSGGTLRGNAHQPKGVGFRSVFRETFSTPPRWAALVCTGVFAAIISFMCLRTNLQLPDTLSIKLPNAYFYLKSGNFFPVVERSDDGRMFATPINGTLLWIYLIRWDQPTRLIVFFNFVCWAIMFFAVYRTSRLIGASRWGSFSAAALFCLTQNLLFQGSSDNDDLMSSVTATIGAVFFLTWIKSRNLQDLTIAAFGIGISAGSKYFPLLYLPGAVACAAYFLLLFISHKDWMELKRCGQHLIIAGLVTTAFLMPYETSRLIYTTTTGAPAPALFDSANRPFRWSVAAHNTIVYNLQLFVSPVTDAIVPKSSPTRSHYVAALNDFSLRNFIPAVKNYWAYAPGIHVAHPDLYDNTVWFGIISWVLGFCILKLLFRKDRWFTPAFWLVVLFLSWNLFFCFRTKYIEELGRYWILPISLIMPVAALFVDGAAARGRGYLTSAVLAIVWGSTFLCGFLGLKDNQIRHNLIDLAQTAIEPPPISNELNEILGTCSRVNVVRTVYGFPIYWLIQRFRGKDFSYFEKSQESMINIVPAMNLAAVAHYEHNFLPIDLLTPRPGRFNYFGFGFGLPLYADAGPDCVCTETCLAENSYLLIQATRQTPVTSPIAKIRLQVLGLHKEHRFRFRASVLNGSETHYLNEWTNESTFYITIGLPGEALTIEVSEQTEGAPPVFTGRLPLQKK